VTSCGLANADEVSTTQQWKLSPFLHVGEDNAYNPQTDRLLASGQPGYTSLRQLLSGLSAPPILPLADHELLVAGGWLVAADEDTSRRYFLKYVSLEGSAGCNQSCYFCPVSVNPRPNHFMPMEMYERIVAQLSEFRDAIVGVSMINYNEPTMDPRFVQQVGLLRQYGLPPAVNTNGTGLTPRRVDQLLELGGLSYLSVNFSTMDRVRYAHDRGHDHVQLVLRNLDYLRDRRLAPRMELVVLGTGNAAHRADFEEISARFAGSCFELKSYEVMDRAGHLEVGAKPSQPHTVLRGCEQTGSRPLQWLHISAHGKCVLCCEDYDEKHVVGDLAEQTVREVLAGPSFALLRRWVYGVEPAPADFLCRQCVFALA
jgi:pyruvate-formate lyase-activating enzyme